MLVKQIRINANGEIVKGDRQTGTTKNDGGGQPDQVQWVRAPGVALNVAFEIDFAPYLTKSPFVPGANPPRIQLPANAPQSAPHPVTQGLGRYKYDVYRDGQLTDDPDVIIE